MTFVSAGVLNLAFGSTAFILARFFYYLRVQSDWPIVTSAILAIGIAGPLLGLVLWLLLFRSLRLSSQLVKVVATIGLSVALPAVAALLFGSGPTPSPTGLAPTPIHVFHIWGAPVTADQVVVLASVVVLGAIGFIVLRYSDLGLRVRAVVDSEAMTSLSGTSPAVVSVGVWIASTFTAGLVGVVVAPIVGLDSSTYTLLMATAFAAVVAARLRYIGRAAVFSLVLGIANGIAERYLPASSSWTPEIVAGIPFALIVLALAPRLRSRLGADESGIGGPLDRGLAAGPSSTTASGKGISSSARKGEGFRISYRTGHLARSELLSWSS